MRPEILAPAGSLEKLKWALNYGADAVYVGGKNYSLRANANNFTDEELKEAVSFAHSKNKKVYITVNMLFHNEDLKEIEKYLLFLEKINVDGLIVTDFGIISLIKKLNIKTPFIISTQESVTNYKTLEFYKSLGASRAVLARECSKEDIKEMKEKVDIELEVFIHGAMCTSYSGRCVLSNYVTKRDSNRGGCAQICRFNFEIEENEEKYAISSKDLNMIDYITDLISLNVESFKIEGRMKSIYYIATVVHAYKNIVDKIINNNLTDNDISYYKKVLERCANRENKAQFFEKEADVKDQYFTGREEVSNQDFLGIVLSFDEQTNEAVIEQRNYFQVGDKVDVFGPHTEVFSFEIKEIINEDGLPAQSAKHPREIIKIKVPNKVNVNDILRVSLLDKSDSL
ncbi:MAG: U32 family peptidase [Bacilli bacterium]|nr:U32 family peptidase [Bacilli bacterium]